jgi:CP family cyanate transporter-like MFS transporter
LPSRRFLIAVVLLWLAGIALRLTILAIPPTIPMIKADFALSATEVGVLVGLPVILFAGAAVPGSLLIARCGALATLIAGLVISAAGSALRGASPGVLALDAATVVMGFGVAIMHPALPPLVRQWLPRHIGFGTAVYTNGLLVGEILPVALTLPLLMPAIGGSWRWALVTWSLPVLAIAALLAILAPRPALSQLPHAAAHRRWWPDWRNGMIWRLGLIFASCNSIYFATNGFVPVYLNSTGRADSISGVLAALNLGQLPVSLLLLAIADRVVGRAWPYALAGCMALVGVSGVVFAAGAWAIAAATLLGFSAAGILVLALALPPLLCRPEDIAPTTAAMFTISYSFAVVTPIVSGALWDMTGIPQAAFVPIAMWALAVLLIAPAVRFRTLYADRTTA